MYNTSYQKCNVFPLCPYFSSMAMEKTLMTHTNGKELNQEDDRWASKILPCNKATNDHSQ